MLENVLGKEVTHKVFGSGTITSKENKNILVQFVDKSVKFVYPDVFEGHFLRTEDLELQEQVTQDIMIKQEEREKYLFSVPANNLYNKPTPSSTKLTQRQVVKSNVAFKCTYCNGGQIPGASLGFNGVCSDGLIKYNIKEKEQVWCSSENSICKEYLAGQISRAELESNLEDGGFVCYESVMLRRWAAYAGIYQSGKNKDKPIKLKQVLANSLVVLTTREPNTPESDRFIFGVFLADESYEGDNQAEGYVTAHPKWRIALSPAETQKILFWKYYANDNSPDKAHWGTGLFRYISDEQAVQILQNIASIRTTPSDKDFAKQFLDHYCTINAIDKASIAPPNGALFRNDV